MLSSKISKNILSGALNNSSDWSKNAKIQMQWSQLLKSNRGQKFNSFCTEIDWYYIYIYIYIQPHHMSRMWHKVNFYVRFNRFESRVFLLDLLPYQRWRVQSALLLTCGHIYTFPKGIWCYIYIYIWFALFFSEKFSLSVINSIKIWVNLA